MADGAPTEGRSRRGGGEAARASRTSRGSNGALRRTGVRRPGRRSDTWGLHLAPRWPREPRAPKSALQAVLHPALNTQRQTAHRADSRLSQLPEKLGVTAAGGGKPSCSSLRRDLEINRPWVRRASRALSPKMCSKRRRLRRSARAGAELGLPRPGTEAGRAGRSQVLEGSAPFGGTASPPRVLPGWEPPSLPCGNGRGNTEDGGTQPTGR